MGEGLIRGTVNGLSPASGGRGVLLVMSLSLGGNHREHSESEHCRGGNDEYTRSAPVNGRPDADTCIVARQSPLLLPGGQLEPGRTSRLGAEAGVAHITGMSRPWANRLSGSNFLFTPTSLSHPASSNADLVSARRSSPSLKLR